MPNKVKKYIPFLNLFNQVQLKMVFFFNKLAS